MLGLIFSESPKNSAHGKKIYIYVLRGAPPVPRYDPTFPTPFKGLIGPFKGNAHVTTGSHGGPGGGIPVGIGIPVAGRW